jgi:hypothetical protein
MNIKSLFGYTLLLSIYIQVITFIIGFFVSLQKIPSNYILIKELLYLELFVQIIEGVFYIWLAYNFKNIINITPKRYFDWIITTPTMLVTLISYLLFLQAKVTHQTHNLTLVSIFKNNYQTLIPILCLNWLMLLFGYLGEIKVLSLFYSVILGFIPFLVYYYMIYKNFVLDNSTGFNIFIYFFFFWSLYGFAALFPYYTKNVLYNILDLFAKNFFGIFLVYVIYTNNY